MYAVQSTGTIPAYPDGPCFTIIYDVRFFTREDAQACVARCKTPGLRLTPAKVEVVEIVD